MCSKVKARYLVTFALLASVGMLARFGAASAQSVIAIGWIGPLTGLGADAGQAARVGAEAAIKSLNERGGVKGAKLRLISFDTRFEPAAAAVEARNMAKRDQVVAIVGDLTTAGTLAAAEVAEELRVPLVTYGATGPDLTASGFRYVFRVAINSSRLAESLVTYAIRDLKAKSLLIVSSDNPASTSKKDFALKETIRLGLAPEKVKNYPYKEFAKDFPGLVELLHSFSPDALILAGSMWESARIVDRVRQAKWKGKILGTEEIADELFLELIGDNSEGIVVSSQFVPVLLGALPEPLRPSIPPFSRTIGNYPVVLNAYDAVTAIARAIELRGPAPFSIRDALVSIGISVAPQA